MPLYEDALTNPEVQAARDSILQPDGVAPPEPHPMVQLARNLLSPVYVQSPDAIDRNLPPKGPLGYLPEGFNPYAAPTDRRGTAGPEDIRGAIQSARNLIDQSPLGGLANAFQQLPIIGGLNDILVKQPIEQNAKELHDLKLIEEQYGRDSKEFQDAYLNALTYAAVGATGGLGKGPLGAIGADQSAIAAKLASAEKAPLTKDVARAASDAADAAAGRIPTTDIAIENLGVNLEKIDAAQPVKDYIEQVARDNAGFEAQRRGVVSIEETMADAQKFAADAQKYAHLKPGTALNAEDLTALKGAMVAKGTEVVKLQDQVASATAAGVRSDELNLRLILAATEHQQLQQAFAGVRAESGRALRIQREITGALKTGTGAAYDNALKAIGGRDNAKALVERLQKVWTDPTLDATAREQATFKFVQNLDKPAFFDHINEFWINSILSSPVTHAVNVTGQTALMIADMASAGASAAIEAVSTVGGLRRPRERFFSEAFTGAFGAIDGLGDGFSRALAMIRNGVSPEAMTKFRETGDIARREANAGALNIPTRLLGAEDQVFYAVGYARGISQSAARIAAKERRGILSGEFGKRVAELKANPTDEMRSFADMLGKRAGLRTEAGDITKQILRVRDVNVIGNLSEKTIGGKAIGKFQPLRYVVPFVNTPVQLVKIGAQYSPAGLVGLVTAKGAERSDVLARSLLGSTGMAFLASQYANGLVTGAAPSDPVEKDAFYREGKLPYSVKIGNEWVSFNRLEPIATPLKWTALAMDAAKGNEGQPFDVTAAKMAGALTKSLSDATYLSGFSALVDALNDPERSASKFLAQIVGGFVPAGVRATVQANDPLIRQPNGIVEQIESTFPGLNTLINPKLDVYGQPAQRSEGKQGISGVISPVDFNAATVNPIDEILKTYNLPDLIGPNGQPMAVRDLQVGFVSQDIANYKLSKDEGLRYQQYAGQATYNMLDALFNNQRPYNGEMFSGLSQVDQIRAIKSTIEDARTVGRSQVADEIVQSSTDPAALSRGVSMRLSTITKQRDRAIYLEGLAAQGKLPSETRAYLDTHKGANDPTVSQYIEAAPLIREYLALPPYLIGNPDEWKALASAKTEMSKFLKQSPAPQGWPDLDWFQRANPALGALVRKYSYTNVRNYKRTQLLQKHPEIDPFVNSGDLP